MKMNFNFNNGFLYMLGLRLRGITEAVFLSTISISMTCIIFILVVFFVTDWSGVQEHIGECILASAIVNLGWYQQFGK
jgi:hypothetical protein